ncbi:hypothetical protein JCM8547_008642 [Rhodosporidiobolus lusitaniae]
MTSSSLLVQLSHRQSMRWSLYRPLLRATAGVPLEQQQCLALREWVREEFKRNSKDKHVQRIRRKVHEAEQFLSQLESTEHSEYHLDRMRELAPHFLARKAVSSPPLASKPAPSPSRKPRLRPSILHSTHFHPPMPRLRPQPLGTSMMIFNRRRQSQKRFDKATLAREMVALGKAEETFVKELRVREDGVGAGKWGGEWASFVREAKGKEVTDYKRNECGFQPRCSDGRVTSTSSASGNGLHGLSLDKRARPARHDRPSTSSHMLFNRFTALSILSLTTATLAASSSHSSASASLAQRASDDSLFSAVEDEFASAFPSSSDDLLLYDDEELERRAFDELSTDLAALPTTSINELTEADLHELDKRCSTCSSGGASVSVHVELDTAFKTCTKKVKKLHTRIKAGVKKCGKKPSAIRVVAAVKADVRELRIAISALGKVCLKVAAKRSKSGLTVKIVGKLLVSLLVTVHACLAEIIAILKVAPLLVVLLAGELLAISAQLVILCNALFGLLGHSLKVYVAGSLSSSVLVGFRSLGCSTIIACLRI